MPNKSSDPKRRSATTQPPASESWLRAHWGKAVVAFASVAIAGVWLWPSDDAATATAATRGKSSNMFSQFPGGANGAASTPVAPRTAQEARLQALNGQFELVDQTLCSYSESTKYPSNSRPIKENPDQVYPNRPIEEQHAMRKEKGGTDANVQLQTSQSRVYLASGEAVVYTIKATDKQGSTLPLFITSAITRGITFTGTRPVAQVALSFTDDGSNGDAVAGDRIFSTAFSPNATGFANFNGTIRTEVKYNVGDSAGVVIFDVIYSPELPAKWTGPVREAIEDGSLVFYLKTDVHVAGRYIVNGRVDDAQGNPFALVTFNDLLTQGTNTIRLTVFGKLLRDKSPPFPLTLRDVDAYLLKEDTDPDRALMPRMEGTALVTKTYPIKSFSDAEWQSEERTRHLTEFSKDVELAKKALVEFNPEQAHQPFPKSECSRERDAQAKSS